MALVVVAVPLLSILPAGADTQGNEGCTPGYWKNHPEAWPTEYSPTDHVGDVWDVARFPSLADDTLLEALGYKGGPGLEDMARILLRQAVAALLNVKHDGVDYPYWDSGVITQTNLRLLNGTRAQMEARKNLWAAANELGCPL